MNDKFLLAPLCKDMPGVCGVGKCQQSLTPPYYSCNCGNYPSTFGKVITDLTKCEASKIYLILRRRALCLYRLNRWLLFGKSLFKWRYM
jgi:hypothetical protein